MLKYHKKDSKAVCCKGMRICFIFLPMMASESHVGGFMRVSLRQFLICLS